ncbi:hypothetical protein [Citrobacter sp. Cpo126]|uniref:hypothetical protein n=1 Tax=Citrobacter sp. Cpo126 TaxID=2985148 RepID=UPI002576D557|nr:hypothetical protein [Citrobacter sp. Cpo126]MDM2772839.1 hypothetical protein [Citrobacter sp. Cpo126]
MDWQGIPFKIIDTDSVQNTFLNVSHIPEIVLKTGFSWDALISGLVAGAIPAIVAIAAMRTNSKNIQAERIHQLELANKNINMQITAASRQVWINDLRESASKFLGEFTAAINSNNALAYEFNEGNQGTDVFNKHYDDHGRSINELAMLIAKITLLLNPDEDESKKVIDVIEKIKNFVNSESDDYHNIDIDDSESLRYEFRVSIYKVIKNEWGKLKGTNS